MVEQATAPRVARMNPDAVDRAKVYTGQVRFYDHEQVVMEGVPFVEVGKWEAEDSEKSAEDFDCSYYAAMILGYKLQMEWITANQDESGRRKYLIYKDLDQDDRIVPFSIEEATIIAAQINFVLSQARHAKEVYMHEDMRTS